ncbi:hypothetical protein AB205_0214660 [Aquarana catesbeiana]|uniref:Uncharacterized protein n=1 Tax=Aquarana catesbeiana TaxID=8400 RepID=A0A2G9RZT5_AQUCT|nr:hypothetical protein AB205_0214660 [Aquarana catesbeiana]PIO33324.1 hypothetical protein AB205_0214660 [Aquarana catesbeiana]
MTDPQTMDEARIMTEKILDFTLEIIYFLTGESIPPVKSGEHMTITVPPRDSLKLEKHTMQKILEVTKRIIEFLIRESGKPGNYNIFVKEEYKEQDKEYGAMKEFLERHKDVTTEPPNNRNPPERCDNHIIPHHDQKGDLINCNNIVKEGVK